jgi:hypothetical protein
MSSFTIQFKNILFGESIFKPCCLYLSLNRHIKWSPIVFLHFVYLLQPTSVGVTTYPGGGVGCNKGIHCICHNLTNSVI